MDLLATPQTNCDTRRPMNTWTNFAVVTIIITIRYKSIFVWYIHVHVGSL